MKNYYYLIALFVIILLVFWMNQPTEKVNKSET